MLLLIFATVAGFLGALLGLGGGIIMVPVLTLYYDLPIHSAVALSLVSVVATSLAASSTFMKENLTNVRIAVFLQVATVFGALSGYFLGQFLQAPFLFVFFGSFLIFSALLMLRQRRENLVEINHPIAERLSLHTETYKVDRPMHGFISMYFAGILSALLGIGSGSMKVLAMDGFMRLPIKVSTATSNFMIGVTAAASAGAFLMAGKIDLTMAPPIVLGISLGSLLGAKTLVRLPATVIRKLFVLVLFIVGVQMIRRGL